MLLSQGQLPHTSARAPHASAGTGARATQGYGLGLASRPSSAFVEGQLCVLEEEGAGAAWAYEVSLAKYKPAPALHVAC